MYKTDVVIIGGGPCGLAAAVGASKAGAKCLILERDERLGGILTQCIHNGFGLHMFNEELTGPEYAERWKASIAGDKNISALTNAFCYSIERANGGFVVSAFSGDGLVEVAARSVVLALGCREKPAGAINLCGSRPAGIFSAGCP